jgi:enoyl-CoA hydratase/carnithine racemase
MANSVPSIKTVTNSDLAVEASDDGVVIEATIDRADRRNALNDNVLDSLMEVMDIADAGPTRVVVIRGSEENFSAGGDLKDMNEEGDDSVELRRENSGKLSELFDKMVSTSALTVAAVEGNCLAGGCGLAAGCEFILAADDATFGAPEIEVGMFPMQAMAAIMRAVNEKHGLEMLFTGDTISASEAKEIGLATQVFERDSYDEELQSYIDDLAASSPTAISLGKEAYYHQRDLPFDHAHRYLKEMLVLVKEGDDKDEGIAAFLENRKPAWKQR